MQSASHRPERYDVVIVGAGFAGIYMLYRLRELGLNVIVVEAGDGVGGTWHWNRYPGARCDIESIDYSYSFSEELQQEWTWTERYASQPEILRYLNHVVDRFELRPLIQLNTRVVRAEFDDHSSEWQVSCDGGAVYVSRLCILATGCLSEPRTPDFPGLDDFGGLQLHTSRWPREGVDLAGRRVGVVGTGSTGIQLIPQIVPVVEKLTVFQRTPNFSVPAQNRPLAPVEMAEVKATYAERRRLARLSRGGVPREFGGRLAFEVSHDERITEYERRWRIGGAGIRMAFRDLLTDVAANATLAEFVRDKIRSQIDDENTAEMLTPRSYPIGAKRLCVDSGYFETFNRPGVTLVDLRAEPVTEVTSTGIQTSARSYDLDVLIFATGFDAITGAILAIDIRGVSGLSLREAWVSGPELYLGLAAADFPNMFFITGPGSPSVLANVVAAIEQHVEWITDLVSVMSARSLVRAEASRDAQSAWAEEVAEAGAKTVYPLADSWYVGANIAGKPRRFMPYIGGLDVYRQRCATVAEAGYVGFSLS